MSVSSARVKSARDLAALVSLKAITDAIVLFCGFSHVSDDDYARVVIAEQFAHDPHLDPSGTSWLPFPFWIVGSAMMIFGRSLATARGVAIVLGCLAPCVLYAALRVVRVRDPLLIAAATTLGPWASWLSIATVPEIPTAALAAAGAIVLTRDEGFTRADAIFGAGIFAACLSRYEAWPIAVVVAIAIAFRARKYGSLTAVVFPLVIAIAGPLAWIGWNVRAHGDAFHFFARVSRFREHTTTTSVLANLTFYPRAIASDAPEIGILLLVVIAAFVTMRGAYVARWRGALGACAAAFAFLVIGALADGAPTHHPARALVVTFPIVIAAGLDAVSAILHSVAEKARIGAVALAASLALMVGWLVAERPATSASESRAPQIARGEKLRADQRDDVRVRPCAYEHFALIAAFGAPERVDIVEPTTRTTPTAACPLVDSM